MVSLSVYQKLVCFGTHYTPPQPATSRNISLQPHACCTHHFYLIRVVCIWNCLPFIIDTNKSYTSFKETNHLSLLGPLILLQSSFRSWSPLCIYHTNSTCYPSLLASLRFIVCHRLHAPSGMVSALNTTITQFNSYKLVDYCHYIVVVKPTDTRNLKDF